MNHIARIGIDIEGVMRSKNIRPQTVDEYLTTAPLKDAPLAIKEMTKLFGNMNIFLISRCPKYAEKTITEWLNSNRLFNDPNLVSSNIYFCRKRIDKAVIAKRLQLTHFIDDRIDVLDAMKNIVANRILFTGGSNHHNTEIDENITVLDSWNSILEHITR